MFFRTHDCLFFGSQMMTDIWFISRCDYSLLTSTLFYYCSVSIRSVLVAVLKVGETTSVCEEQRTLTLTIIYASKYCWEFYWTGCKNSCRPVHLGWCIVGTMDQQFSWRNVAEKSKENVDFHTA